MNKKDLSESDIKAKFITPAITGAGWNEQTQLGREIFFTDGRIYVKGRITARGKRKFADYILFYKPNVPIAVIEAKDNKHSVKGGIQQALGYANTLDIPFVFSSNGDGFYFHDKTAMDGEIEIELSLNDFPSPELHAAELNIFDAESPTHKKLEYFIFENTKVEEDAIAQMYFYVIRKLYQKNTQLLLSNQELFKITREASDFRAPQDLINGYFIEANIDSNTKFNTLKKLLTVYDLEDELIIKYDPASNNGKSEPSRFSIRKKYWQQLLPLLSNTDLFSKVNPTKDHWLSIWAGISGLAYTLIITRSCVRVELGISSSSKEQNKKYFHKLYSEKEEIESRFGSTLVWEELAEHKMSRVKSQLDDVDLFEPNDWEMMNKYLIETLPKFERAFKPAVNKLK